MHAFTSITLYTFKLEFCYIVWIKIVISSLVIITNPSSQCYFSLFQYEYVIVHWLCWCSLCNILIKCTLQYHYEIQFLCYCIHAVVAKMLIYLNEQECWWKMDGNKHGLFLQKCSQRSLHHTFFIVAETPAPSCVEVRLLSQKSPGIFLSCHITPVDDWLKVRWWWFTT